MTLSRHAISPSRVRARLEPARLSLSLQEERTLAALYMLESVHGYPASTSTIAREARVSAITVTRCAHALEAKGLVRPVTDLGREYHWEIHVNRPGARSLRWYGATMLALAKIAEKHQGNFGWNRPAPGTTDSE